MTRKLAFTFALGLLFGSVVTAAAVYALQSQTDDPVKLSPQYYKVPVDNDRVRVLEYHLPVGQREPMHSHPPGIVYYTKDAKFRTTLPNGTVSEVSAKAGEIHWREATTHAAENIGQTDATAIAVELKPCR